MWPYVWPQHCKGYLSLGSGKLDAEVIRNNHPRSIVAFSKAVERGLGEKISE
jgi:hypothetical protein